MKKSWIVCFLEICCEPAIDLCNCIAGLVRRVIKRTQDATHTFVYDRWLLVVERIERSNCILEQIDYWWGKDLSGTLYDAGGIGGLLYIRKNGCDVYVPLADARPDRGRRRGEFVCVL